MLCFPAQSNSISERMLLRLCHPFIPSTSANNPSQSKSKKKTCKTFFFGHPPIFVQAMNSTENELIVSYRSILTTQCLQKGKEPEMRGITWHQQEPSWSPSPSSLLLPMDDLEMSTFVCFRLFPVQKLRQFRTF